MERNKFERNSKKWNWKGEWKETWKWRKIERNRLKMERDRTENENTRIWKEIEMERHGNGKIRKEKKWKDIEMVRIEKKWKESEMEMEKE